MATAMQMVHAKDPKAEILDEVGPFLKDVQPLGTGVLIGVYIRPNKTAGGIMLVDTVGARREDAFQGKTALVLAMGEMAFTEDANHRWGGVIPKVGDWVAINVGDTWAFELGSRRCRVVEDVDVKLVLQRPDIVW
jgi:co-chaperonin GroES (HSP10)